MSENSDQQQQSLPQVILSKLWSRNREKAAPVKQETYLTSDGSITQVAWDGLHVSTSNDRRKKTILDLTQLIRERQLQVSTLEGIWHETEDMLDHDQLSESFLRFIIEMTSAQSDHLGIALRHSFFLAIKDIGCTDLAVEWLANLLSYGKELEPFESNIGPLITEWLYKEYRHKSSEKKMSVLLDVTGEMIRQNAAHIETDNLCKIVLLCGEMIRKRKKFLTPYCVRVLLAVIRFYTLPEDLLPDFVYLLCVIINDEDTYEDAWHLARLGLTSVNSHMVIRYLEALLNKGQYMTSKDSKEKLKAIRGAVIIISNASWGEKFILLNSRINLPLIFETFQYAVKLGQYVANIVIQTIARMVEKYYSDLNASTWDGIFCILMECLVCCKREKEYSKILKDVQSMVKVIVVYYQVRSSNKTAGYSKKLYDVVELCLKIESMDYLTIALLEHKIDEITPTKKQWIASAVELFERFYVPKYSIPVRRKVIDVLRTLYDNFGLLYEEDLIDGLITPSLKHMFTESNVEVKMKMIDTLFYIAERVQVNNVMSFDSDSFSKLMDAVADFFNQPIDNLIEANYENIIIPKIRKLICNRWRLMNPSNVNKVISVLVDHIMLYYNSDLFGKQGENARMSIFKLLLSISINFKLGDIEITNLNEEGKSVVLANARIELFDSYDVPNCFTWTVICDLLIYALSSEESWKVMNLILDQLPKVLLNKKMVDNLAGHTKDKFIHHIMAFTTISCERRFSVSSEEFNYVYLPVVAVMMNYYPCDEIISYMQNQITNQFASGIQAINIAMHTHPTLLNRYFYDILFELKAIDHFSIDFAIATIEFICDAITFANANKICVDSKINTIIDVLFGILNAFIENNTVICLVVHTIMKWFTVLQKNERVSFMNHAFDKFEKYLSKAPKLSSKTTLPTHNTSHRSARCSPMSSRVSESGSLQNHFAGRSKNITKYIETSNVPLVNDIKLLLTCYFKFWLDINQKPLDSGNNETICSLEKGYKEKEVTHLVNENSIITLQVFTSSRLTNPAFMESFLEKKGRGAGIDRKISNRGLHQAFTEQSSAGLALEFEDINMSSNDTGDRERKRHKSAIQRPVSVFVEDPAMADIEPAIEYVQITMRHIFGKQMWLMRAFDGIPTDFYGEIGRRFSDHETLIRHLYSNEKASKVPPSEKVALYLKNMDKISIREDINVGVMFMGSEQITSSAILSNVYGSYRFTNFFKRLGKATALVNHPGGLREGVDVISQIGASAVFCLLRVAKYSVGRLRPNFVLTCIPNTSSITCVLGYAHQYDCTNEHKSWVIESRLSFFSGHAAHTFYILMFVTFYLNIRIHKKSYLRYMISFLYIIMISFATVVASSRVSDNKHHPSDVLMGVLVGVSFAFCTVTFFVDDFERVIFLTYSLFVTPYQRGFFCDDETIRLPYFDDTVTVKVLMLVSIVPNILLIFFSELDAFKSPNTSISSRAQRSRQLFVSIGHFLFGLHLMLTFITVIKVSNGRLRPHFIDVCAPDVFLSSECTGHNYITNYTCTRPNTAQIREARLSFPSGHTSISFYAAIFFVLYIHSHCQTLKDYYLLPITLQFLALLLAAYTSISRITDHKHHYEDVLSGMLIGWTFAYFTYTICVGSQTKLKYTRQNVQSSNNEDSREVPTSVVVVNEFDV
uniref:Rap-GAP domain-containing protein n=1 Tax=Rhabditophanes sp. KR3021 TaxID=114890 RepID=A0AC35U649_9BILA